MTNHKDALRTDLAERLLAHAELHANSSSPHDDEQAQWERDLREAASALRSRGEAKPVAYIETTENPPGSEFDGEVDVWLLPPGINPPAGTQPLYLHPATPASAWRPIAEAALLTRNAVGVSGPCAVLLRIDTGRPGPFIRQGRFDAAAGAFVCDSTGQVLRDAIAFVEPEFPTPPTSTKGG